MDEINTTEAAQHVVNTCWTHIIEELSALSGRTLGRASRDSWQQGAQRLSLELHALADVAEAAGNGRYLPPTWPDPSHAVARVLGDTGEINGHMDTIIYALYPGDDSELPARMARALDWLDDPDWTQVERLDSGLREDVCVAYGYLRGMADALGITARELFEREIL